MGTDLAAMLFQGCRRKPEWEVLQSVEVRIVRHQNVFSVYGGLHKSLRIHSFSLLVSLILRTSSKLLVQK